MRTTKPRRQRIPRQIASAADVTKQSTAATSTSAQELGRTATDLHQLVGQLN